MIPGAPGTTVPFLPTNLVPIYNVYNQINATPIVPEDTHSSLPLHKSKSTPVHTIVIENISIGFIVSIPLKQLSHQDTLSQAEIAFEWDIPFIDFYNHICACIDLDPKDVALGYKFKVDPKKSIVWLPSNNPVAFNTMVGKVKSHITRACTCAVVLEIHNLVYFIDFV